MRPVVLCYGTRPQVIKASVVRRLLMEAGPVVAVDTGQHYDYELNALLYAQLDVSPPDHCLDVGSASHGVQTAAILERTEGFLRGFGAGAVVVIGDTNSTLGAALAAAKLRIPVVHVEAGLRACDGLMAEEINRRAVDSFARLLCTPSAAATARMQSERPDAQIVETGDVARDVLESQLARLPSIDRIRPAGAADFIFATLHRAELTEHPSVLTQVLETLASLDRPVLMAMHPRTHAALEGHGLGAGSRGTLTIMPAVGYHESLALTRAASAVITDSGGVQREAYWLGT